MASGKKNYFRHSNNSFEDEKIQKCIDLLGYEGYAYYFILLEILAKKCEESYHNPITIHQQTLRNVWRKQTKSCIKVVEKLQESGLFVATFRKSFVEFDIPNLSKYLGTYQSKFSSNSPNKRKEKEKKENKSKINENKINEKEKNKNLKKENEAENLGDQNLTYKKILLTNAKSFENLFSANDLENLKSKTGLSDADLQDEFEKMALWSTDKNQKRSVSGWNLFTRNWLNKAQKSPKQKKSNSFEEKKYEKTVSFFNNFGEVKDVNK